MKRLAFVVATLLLVPVLVRSSENDEPKTRAPVSTKGHAAVTPSASRTDAYVRPLSEPAERVKVSGVRNAAKVSEALYRGAQPTAQGLAELKKLGVTTIVDLRGNRGEVNWERQKTEALGMRFANIAVLGWSSPANIQVAQFLKLFEDPHQTVFVHCRFGEDRTGVMVAAYRIAQQHWTAEQAAQEMSSFGFHSYLYPGMRSYIRKFPASYASEPAFAALHSMADVR